MIVYRDNRNCDHTLTETAKAPPPKKKRRFRRHLGPAIDQVPALRPCIGPRCRGKRSFMSAHAGNRLCPSCAQLVDRLDGHGVGPGDGALPQDDAG